MEEHEIQELFNASNNATILEEPLDSVHPQHPVSIRSEYSESVMSEDFSLTIPTIVNLLLFETEIVISGHSVLTFLDECDIRQANELTPHVVGQGKYPTNTTYATQQF